MSPFGGLFAPPERGVRLEADRRLQASHAGRTANQFVVFLVAARLSASRRLRFSSLTIASSDSANAMSGSFARASSLSR